MKTSSSNDDHSDRSGLLNSTDWINCTGTMEEKPLIEPVVMDYKNLDSQSNVSLNFYDDYRHISTNNYSRSSSLLSSSLSSSSPCTDDSEEDFNSSEKFPTVDNQIDWYVYFTFYY